MWRIIIDRPRVSAGDRKGRTTALEDMPKQEGMRRPYRLSGDWKMQTDRLNPLRRYLEQQIGRPWDKVYSEICAHLRMDCTVQQHLREHLDNFVAIRPRRLHDTVYDFPGVGRIFHRVWYQLLYVDPKDGLLKRTDNLPDVKALRRGRKRSQAPDRINLADDRELRRIDGHWYELMLAPLPDPSYRSIRQVRCIPLKRGSAERTIAQSVTIRHLASAPVFDLATGAMIPVGPTTDDKESWMRYRRDYPDRRYAVRKRSLSRAELLRHGIANDSPKL